MMTSCCVLTGSKDACVTAVVDLRDEMDEPTDNSSDEEDVNADAPKVRQQSLDVTSINERSINKDELTRVCVCVCQVEVQNEDRQQNVAPLMPEVIARKPESV